MNGQEICTVVGVAAATLTASDFVFRSHDTAGPELAPAFGDQTAAPGFDTALVPNDIATFAPWAAPAAHHLGGWMVMAA